MKMRRFGAVGALVAAGLVLGYLFGPPLVNAAGNAPATTSDVHIKDNTQSYKANVTSKNRLSVDTEAAVTDLGADFLDTFGLQYQLPNGQDMLANGSTGCSKVNNDQVVLASVNINMTSGQANPVTVTVQNGGTTVAYQTTFAINEVGSHDFSFDGGVYFSNGFKVIASPSSAGLSCEVLGQDLGLSGPSLHAVRK
jgi:hypothetical protein